jgi:hypothetical protein
MEWSSDIKLMVLEILFHTWFHGFGPINDYTWLLSMYTNNETIISFNQTIQIGGDGQIRLWVSFFKKFNLKLFQINKKLF